MPEPQRMSTIITEFPGDKLQTDVQADAYKHLVKYYYWHKYLIVAAGLLSTIATLLKVTAH